MPNFQKIKTAARHIREAEPKISGGEIYFLLAFALLADAVNWAPIVNWIVTMVTLPGYQFYFKMRGVNGAWSLGGNLIELIPLVSMLPAVTAGVLATILFDHFAPESVKQSVPKIGK